MYDDDNKVSHPLVGSLVRSGSRFFNDIHNRGQILYESSITLDTVKRFAVVSCGRVKKGNGLMAIEFCSALNGLHEIHMKAQGRSKGGRAWGGLSPPKILVQHIIYKRIHVDVIVRAVTQIEHIPVLQVARIVCHNSSRHTVLGTFAV